MLFICKSLESDRKYREEEREGGFNDEHINKSLQQQRPEEVKERWREGDGLIMKVEKKEGR